MKQKHNFDFTPFVARKIIKRKKVVEKKSFSWKKLLMWGLGILGGILVLGVIAAVATIAFIVRDLPDVRDLDKFFVAESTQIFDREGNLLYTVHGDENRQVVQIFDRTTDQILPEYANIVNATLAIEDDRFFQHDGFDIPGIVKAVCHETLGDVGGMCPQRGGSTITQQYIKMAFLTDERTITRKIKELVLAVRLEQTFSKNEILELYLNKIPYGNNAFGIEAAAETYFGKHANELSLAEAAVLAGIPNAPSRYNPYGSGKDALMGYYDDTKLNPDTGRFGVYVHGRKDTVLTRMKDLGWITDSEKDSAWTEANSLEFSTYIVEMKHPHFVLYIKQLLEEKYGSDMVETGGLKVYTTLDPKLQDYAEQLLAENEERLNNYGADNAALLSADPKTGQILAMVGSVDYWNEEIDGNVNVAIRPRLPGSSFKPYVYANAFSQSYGAGTILYDVRTNFGATSQGDYTPENYDGTFSGPVTARYALDHSLNIPAVKMAYLGGVDKLLDLVYDFGITSLEDRRSEFGPSLALGAGEITMLEHVQGYTTFVNQGKRINLTPFLRIEDSSGKVLEEFEQEEGEQVLDPQVAYEIVNILSDSNAKPSWSNALSVPGQIAGWKTGTANKVVNNIKLPSDCWTMGFTNDVVTGVWTGNTDGSALKGTADGSNVAGPIWKAFMIKATEGKLATDYEKPAGITWLTISTLSGKIASESTPDMYRRSEMFASFAVPREVDDSVVTIKVDRVTGLLPVEDCPESALEERTFYNIHSEMPNMANWEKGVLAWAEKAGFANKLAPTEYTNLCTPEYNEMRNDLPTITILSPTEMGTVSAGKVGVTVQVEAKYGIEKVEYLLNGENIQTVQSYPYKGTIDLSNAKEGDKYTIKALAYDSFSNVASSQVTVEVGEDKTSPVVQIDSPAQGKEVQNKSSLTVSVTAYDTQSDIEKVMFFLDGASIGQREVAPYNLTFQVDTSAGMHTLSAVAKDLYGNQKTSEVAINVVEGEVKEYEWSYGDAAAVFLAPTSGTHIPAGVQTNFMILVNPNLDVSSIEVAARRDFEAAGVSNQRITIATITDIPEGGSITFPWANPAYGEYEVFARVNRNNGDALTTSHIKITAE